MTGIPGDEGGWHFLNEPRPFHHDGTTFLGYIQTDGDVVLHEHDNEDGTDFSTKLYEEFVTNGTEHANPSLLERSDGHILAFWDRTSDIHYRISENPYDLSSFGSVQTISANDDYANGVELSDEDNRVYLFSRRRDPETDDREAVYRTSDDGGESWSSYTKLADIGNWQYPFVRRGGSGSIHIMITRNPGNHDDNDLLYIKYEDGSFYNADGTEVATESELPLNKSDFDIVHDSSEFDCRGDDIQVGDDGTPYLTYNVYKGDDKEDHRYHRAHWNGSEWETHEILATTPLTDEDPAGDGREWMYYGGVVMDSTDPDTVYASEEIDGTFEIGKATTDDGGSSWSFEEITSGSNQDNFRPQSIANPNESMSVIWMRGWFEWHNDWDADVHSNKAKTMDYGRTGTLTTETYEPDEGTIEIGEEEFEAGTKDNVEVVDGVVTLRPSAIIDDFESYEPNGTEELTDHYTETDRDSSGEEAQITESSVFEGEQAVTATDATVTLFSPGGGGLENYPARGTEFVFHAKGGSEAQARFFFGSPDDFDADTEQGYHADISLRDDELRLRVTDADGSMTTLDSTAGVGFSTDTWYRARITWEETDEITVEAEDPSTDETLATISGTDSTWSDENGIAWAWVGNQGLSNPSVFDLGEITDEDL